MEWIKITTNTGEKIFCPFDTWLDNGDDAVDHSDDAAAAVLLLLRMTMVSVV